MPGRDEFFRAGFPHGDRDEMPVDLAAVQADDALLDMIGRAGCAPSEVDDELTRVLAAWRSEVHAEPISELVDTDTAVKLIRAGRQPARGRNPVFGSLAAAAAVLVIAFSGVGLAAKSAQPGDHLWGVTRVLYGDYARSVETAATVRTELNEARTALQQGNPERARASLQRVQKQLPVINDTEGRTDLTARSRELEQQVVQSSGQPGEQASPKAQSPQTPSPQFPSPQDPSPQAPSPYGPYDPSPQSTWTQPWMQRPSPDLRNKEGSSKPGSASSSVTTPEQPSDSSATNSGTAGNDSTSGNSDTSSRQRPSRPKPPPRPQLPPSPTPPFEPGPRGYNRHNSGSNRGSDFGPSVPGSPSRPEPPDSQLPGPHSEQRHGR